METRLHENLFGDGVDDRGLQDFFNAYEPFEFLLTFSQKRRRESTKNISLDDCNREINRRAETGHMIRTKMPKLIPKNLILIDCVQLNEQLATLDRAAQPFLQDFAADLIERSIDLKEQFKQTMGRLNRRCTISQELVESEAYLKEVDSIVLDDLLRKVAEAKRRLDFLFGKYHVTDTVLVPVGITFSWSRKVVPLVNQAQPTRS